MTVEIPSWATWVVGGALGFAFAWGQMKITVGALERDLRCALGKIEHLSEALGKAHLAIKQLEWRISALDGREPSGVHDTNGPP